MALRGFKRNFKPLEILAEEQVEAICRGTLDVLQETGVRVEHEKALNLFKENGCEVDFEKKRVKFPPGLVEECLRKCPSSYRVKARDPKNDVILGENAIYFTNFPGTNTVDLDSWEPRTATKKEFYDYVTVLDALHNHHWQSAYPYFGFEGLPEVMKVPEGTAARIRNSTKVLWGVNVNNADIFTIKMAKAVGTEIVPTPNPSPPLTWYDVQVNSIFLGVEAGFSITLISGCVYGGSGPVTIAGSVITHNAELIAGIVLAQLISSGTRVSVGNLTHPQNMETGAPAFGAMGKNLHQVIFNQIWRKYGIPRVNCSVGPSGSKRIDFQCGYEKAMGALTAALSGANLLQYHGGIYGEKSAHPVQAILDDDIAGMVGHFIKGVKVNDETLAIDLIEEVGPIPGFYLDKEHTRKWWKKEQFVRKAADGLTYPEWKKTGKKSCLDYAKERMDEILATHGVSIPLTDDQNDAIESILKEAKNYYREKGLISKEA